MQSVFQIPVKMGSHKLVIDLESNCEMTSVQFVELVLKKCKLTSNEKLTKTYSVFESVNGVEKMLKSNEIITDVWKYWIKQSVQHSVQFIVRKCVSVEKKLTATTESDKRKKMIKKCYKKINSETSSELIQDKRDIKTKREFLKKIVENEQELKKQADQLLQIEALLQNLTSTANKQIQDVVVAKETTKPVVKSNKMCSYHQSNLINNLNEKLSDNVNFLQFLYLKLKKQGSSQNKSFSYEKLIDNSCGNSSGGEDYDSASNRSSRTTSTSTLESLV